MYVMEYGRNSTLKIDSLKILQFEARLVRVFKQQFPKASDIYKNKECPHQAPQSQSKNYNKVNNLLCLNWKSKYQTA